MHPLATRTCAFRSHGGAGTRPSSSHACALFDSLNTPTQYQSHTLNAAANSHCPTTGTSSIRESSGIPEAMMT